MGVTESGGKGSDLEGTEATRVDLSLRKKKTIKRRREPPKAAQLHRIATP